MPRPQISDERKKLLGKLMPGSATALQQDVDHGEVLQGEILKGPGVDYDEWLPEHKIHDSRFQPRGAISKHQPAVQRLMRAIDAQGQLQSILVRPHPDKPGEWEQIIGHRRKYCVRFGANARGVNKPDAGKYKGLIRARISFEPWTDLELIAAAMSENIDRENLNVLEQARGFNQAFEMVRKESGKKKMDAWAEVSSIFGLSYQHMTRMAFVLELPEEWQKHFGAAADGHNPDEDRDEFALNGTHVRALYTLRDYPDQQRVIWNSILKQRWSGTRALDEATELQKKARNQQPTLQQQAENQKVKKAKRAAANSAGSETPATSGKPSLTLVPRADPPPAPPIPGEEPAPDPVTPAPDQNAPFDGLLIPRVEQTRQFRAIGSHIGVAAPHLNYVCDLVAGGHAGNITPDEANALAEQMRGFRSKLDQAEAYLQALTSNSSEPNEGDPEHENDLRASS
jgi:ParB/RepB/Spo0J family partition protein